jgi:hypothetical protein
MVNTIFIFDLQMINNCNNVIFGMGRSKDDMSKVLVESPTIFVWSLGIFTKSSKLWPQLVQKFV